MVIMDQSHPLDNDFYIVFIELSRADLIFLPMRISNEHVDLKDDLP